MSGSGSDFKKLEPKASSWGLRSGALASDIWGLEIVRWNGERWQKPGAWAGVRPASQPGCGVSIAELRLTPHISAITLCIYRAQYIVSVELCNTSPAVCCLIHCARTQGVRSIPLSILYTLFTGFTAAFVGVNGWLDR